MESAGVPKHRMARHAWVWVLATAALLLLFLMLARLPGHLVVEKGQALESAMLEREGTRAAGSLRSELLVLEDLCRDWSDWDDTYRFVQDGNPGFAKANLAWDSLITTTRIHLVGVFDDRGRTVWAGFRTRPDGPDLPLPSYLTSRWPLPRRNGFLLTPEGPLLVSMRPIVLSNGTGDPRGVLVMGRLLDDRVLERIRTREKTSFRIQDTLRLPLEDPHRTLLSQLQEDRLYVERRSDRADVHLLLPDLERKGGLLLEVTIPLEVHAQSLAAARTATLSLLGALAGVVAVLAFSFWLYRREFLRHRRELETAVEQRTAELSRANHALEEASMVDLLTGLRNRRYAELTLPGDVAHALRQRHPEAPAEPPKDLVIYLLDLDHFKVINDDHGHAAGDSVLQQVGELLKRVGRTSDLAVRWGGEEFLVLARHTRRSHAPTLAESLLKSFQDHPFHLPGGKPIKLTCSIGYCPFPVVPGQPDGLTVDQAIMLADLCMYAAKRSGRNGWIGFTAPDSLEPRRLLEAFPRGFVHLAKAGILDVRSSLGEVGRITWV